MIIKTIVPLFVFYKHLKHYLLSVALYITSLLREYMFAFPPRPLSVSIIHANNIDKNTFY